MFRSSLKAIALVDIKIDYMLLQRRQIIKLVENRKDIQDPGNIRYAITSFDYIVRTHPHYWHDALCR
jgi:hypothetical protein